MTRSSRTRPRDAVETETTVDPPTDPGGTAPMVDPPTNARADGRPVVSETEPIPDPATDLALLRRFEPVVRYTRGEQFFPAPVDGYLARSDLLVGRSERDRRVLLPLGDVSTDVLDDHAAPPGENLYLRLVQDPFDSLELARWQMRRERDRFKAPGRLARVGLFARLVDAGFTVSLLLRGTVPGGTAAAAQVKYAESVRHDPRVLYHARAVRRNGWIVLHYLFFYFMNDYRSTFGGANDHEADWEQVFVYLDDAPDGPRPVWIAAAAHDYTGDDLRRRWDDPDLVLQGEHPVIFAGGGSHASYFEQGEYLTQLPLPFARGARGALDALRTFWRDTLNQPDPGDLAQRIEGALSVPFIDYARGDGKVVGPDGDLAWDVQLIDDDVPWVDGYRGLFGLDTFDRFAGERAPAGPKYTRAGTVRQSWNDPLGFAGLDKVAPPSRQPDHLQARIAGLVDELAATDTAITDLTQRLPGIELEVRALGVDGAFARQHEERATELASTERELAASRAHRADVSDAIGASRRELARLEAGDAGDPQAHLHHVMRPVPPEHTRYGILVELWSAVSVSIMLLLIVGLIWFDLMPWWGALLIGVLGYALIEAALRRRFTQFVLRGTLLLAIFGAAVLVWEFRLEAVLVGIVGVAVLIFSDNVREVIRR
ncbi:MAG: hypothetical protein KF809_06900 [Chloroflexi bacterium]|nr:hypothetical protein [Chloroflexota bacterium]